MFICIATNENQFLVLDTNDGVCEWTSIQKCRRFLENGVRIVGLSLVRIDDSHSYIQYTPSNDFIPKQILRELQERCNNVSDYNKLLTIAKRYILSGNNIIAMRNNARTFNNFQNNLARWCYNG